VLIFQGFGTNGRVSAKGGSVFEVSSADGALHETFTLTGVSARRPPRQPPTLRALRLGHPRSACAEMTEAPQRACPRFQTRRRGLAGPFPVIRFPAVVFNHKSLTA
jgi:hypothetical protein